MKNELSLFFLLKKVTLFFLKNVDKMNFGFLADSVVSTFFITAKRKKKELI
jgi:hypothetical protein